MVRHRYSVILLLISVVILSCESDPNAPVSGTWNFALQKTWEIDRVGDELLDKPGELRVATDGTLFFHDFARKTSYALDQNGQFTGTFGQKGDGPGEVSWYINCFTADNSVVIGAPDKLHFYTNTGKFIRAIPNDLFARFPQVFINENEFLVAPGALPDAPNGEAIITYVDLKAGEEKVFDQFPLSDEEKGGTRGAVIVGLTPQLAMAYNPQSGRLYYAKNNEYVIYVADLDGNRYPTFGLEREKLPVTEDAKRKHFARFGIPQERVDAMIGSLPNEMAYFHRLQVNDGLVYVFLTSGLGQTLTSQPLDIFSLDGKYLYRAEITFDDNQHIYGNPDNLQIRDNYLYAILEDSTGKKMIAKYRISLPDLGGRRPE